MTEAGVKEHAGTRMIRKLAAAGLMLAAALCNAQTPAPSESEPGAPARELADIVRQDLESLDARLNDPNARQEERDEAARRLISRQTPQTRRMVADALVNLNPGGQLAAARALADDPNPDPALVDALFAALGTNRQLSEAAARALSNYKTSPEVISRLLDYVLRRPPTEIARLPVIRAIGSIPEKRCAQFLVEILQRPDESPAARTAAAEALAEMTGLSDAGVDPQRWAQWWNANSPKSDVDFRADLLPRRALRHDQLRQQFSQLSSELVSLLREQYRGAAAPQRVELMMRFLRSSEPQVRAVAAAIILEEALELRPPAPAVLAQLRELVGDSSAAVRVAAAEALGTINDVAAFEALMGQLSQEPDPTVRAALARALGPMNDLRAVPLLAGLLMDPSYDVSLSAAAALRKLGPLLAQKDSEMTRELAVALRQALEKRTGTPPTAELRKNLVDAMVPLRQDNLAPLFRQMLDERRGETLEVRQLAVRGIGELGKAESAGILVTALGDRSAAIRLEAANALSKNPALTENTEPLRPLIDPQHEPDASVRDAAWRALETALPGLPKAQLQVWADRFRDDPSRRLIVLRALAQRQARDMDDDNLASTRENIAAELMKLRQYKEAADAYGQALEYKKMRSVSGAVIESLRRERMRALLLSRDYASAVAFAEQSIREEPGAVQLMGGLIRTQVETLREELDLQPALELIEAVRKMNPPLPAAYNEDLARLDREIQQLQSQQNGASPQPGPRSAGTGASSNGRSASSN